MNAEQTFQIRFIIAWIVIGIIYLITLKEAV